MCIDGASSCSNNGDCNIGDSACTCDTGFAGVSCEIDLGKISQGALNTWRGRLEQVLQLLSNTINKK